MTCAPGLPCAEENVGNLNRCTFKNSGTPVRRPKRRTSEQMYFQEFWDSCAQNKTSKISRNALSRILGLLYAEQNVGNLKNAVSESVRLQVAEQNVGNLTQNAFSEIVGLLCAEQNVDSVLPIVWWIDRPINRPLGGSLIG